MSRFGFSVIKQDVEKCKNLETATLTVNGFQLDLVNLRVKGYERVGTAQEDAFLRDLTINAMFYNINEGKIEDYVGGMKDLQEKVCRTPIEALQTFTDDPLRLLRCVRFANKFDF